jgi:hypothetical protein
MRHRFGIVLGIAVCLALATGLAFGGDLKVRKHRREVKSLLAAPTFSAAGEFSGALEGTLVINGSPYELAPNAWIYDVGRGALPVGTFVERGFVACSGVMAGGSRIIYHVILRTGAPAPANDTEPIRPAPMEGGGVR